MQPASSYKFILTKYKKLFDDKKERKIQNFSHLLFENFPQNIKIIEMFHFFLFSLSKASSFT